MFNCSEMFFWLRGKIVVNIRKHYTRSTGCSFKRRWEEWEKWDRKLGEAAEKTRAEAERDTLFINFIESRMVNPFITLTLSLIRFSSFKILFLRLSQSAIHFYAFSCLERKTPMREHNDEIVHLPHSSISFNYSNFSLTHSQFFTLW